MSVKIKQGTLTDFLDSARDTAREIDSGKKLTRKKTVWVEPEDMEQLLKPERKVIQPDFGREKSLLEASV